MFVVFGFNDGDGDARLEIQDVVGAADGFFIALRLVAANDDATTGEIDLFQELGCSVPPGCLDGWRDELGADVTLGKRLLVHSGMIGRK